MENSFELMVRVERNSRGGGPILVAGVFYQRGLALKPRWFKVATAVDARLPIGAQQDGDVFKRSGHFGLAEHATRISAASQRAHFANGGVDEAAG